LLLRKKETLIPIAQRQKDNNFTMKQRRWGPSEDAIIRQYYPTGGTKAVLEHLWRKRTASQVTARAIRIGVSSTYKNSERFRKTTDISIRRGIRNDASKNWNPIA